MTAIEPYIADDEPNIWLGRGLVDLQINGYGGFDFNHPHSSVAQVRGAVLAQVRRGITTLLPTLVTASPRALLARIEAIVGACDLDEVVRDAVAGIHLEGPFISSQDGPRGVHDPAHVRGPDLAELDGWIRTAMGLPLLITVAPELPGMPAFIAEAVARHVRVSIGHSAADPAHIRAAVAAGASMSTHLGNGVGQALPRHPNLIWEQLASDQLAAGFIADGFHLDAATFRSMLAAKGLSRSVLVSDATAIAGLPPGVYPTTVGGSVELEPSGRLHPVGHTHLAGAAVDLSVGVARAAILSGRGLPEVYPLASDNPRRLLMPIRNQTGGRPIGPFRVGERADLIRFRHLPGDDSIDVLAVALGEHLMQSHP